MDIIQCNLLVKVKRKWKSRWVVLRRVNPGSDRINLYIYKDRLSAIGKQQEKFLLSLRDFCYTECVDKDNRLPKIVIITEAQALSLRFDKKEDRDYWEDTLIKEGGFGQVVTYNGLLPSRQSMKSGEVSLHIYPNFFTLIRKKNSRCIGRWQFEQLFNYGPVDGGFVFRVENVSEDNSEPESFLLVTSSEKQINSTFDTVYKTAHNMYGSADGIQKSTKLNSLRAPRPRSMSEPSGFKRFMQRLSIRRKSRRPKSSKWKENTGPTDIKINNAVASAEDVAHFGEGSLKNNDAIKRSKNDPNPESTDKRKSNESVASSSSGISPSPSDGILSCDMENHGRISPGDIRTLNGNKHDDERQGQDAGEKNESTKLSLLDTNTQNGNDMSIWQRRSALFLNTDDMIREGFMKSKQSDQRSCDVPANEERNHNNELTESSEGKALEGTGIQARRNTSGNRVKRPMLTIQITPSLSQPSLNQYVNVPEKPHVKDITRLQPGVWDRYDSEESVYHNLDRVIGGPSGYQNLPGSGENTHNVSSTANSYQNVAARLPDARSYENVAGPRSDMHYINVDAKQSNSSVNYIKVSGSGPSTPIQKNQSFNSKKGNPDYTEIDFVKTKRFREMSMEVKKEKVERVKKS